MRPHAILPPRGQGHRTAIPSLSRRASPPHPIPLPQWERGRGGGQGTPIRAVRGGGRGNCGPVRWPAPRRGGQAPLRTGRRHVPPEPLPRPLFQGRGGRDGAGAAILTRQKGRCGSMARPPLRFGEGPGESGAAVASALPRRGRAVRVSARPPIFASQGGVGGMATRCLAFPGWGGGAGGMTRGGHGRIRGGGSDEGRASAWRR